MTRGGAFVLLAAALFVACQRPAETAPVNAATRHQHPNGLVVSAAAQWRASTLADGLRFEPAEGNAGRREALVVTVMVSDAAPSPELRQTERIGDRSLAYRVDRSADAGSAGPEYQLTAVEPWAGRFLWWRQSKQSERGEPAFELWELARGLAPAQAGANVSR
jgi:hypothetical protein